MGRRSKAKILFDSRIELRCLAFARSTGKPCQSTATWPTKKGKGKRRCRMHGGQPGKHIQKTEAGRKQAFENLRKGWTKNRAVR